MKTQALVLQEKSVKIEEDAIKKQYIGGSGCSNKRKTTFLAQYPGYKRTEAFTACGLKWLAYPTDFLATQVKDQKSGERREKASPLPHRSFQIYSPPKLKIQHKKMKDQNKQLKCL